MAEEIRGQIPQIGNEPPVNPTPPTPELAQPEPELSLPAGVPADVAPVPTTPAETPTEVVPTPPAPSPPTMESGPANVSQKPNLAKYGILGLITLLVVAGVLAGYMFLRGMAVPKEIPVIVEVQESTETTATQTQQDTDTTSLDALEKNFDEISMQLETLEEDMTFEQNTNLTSPEF
ncbi:hypothetical protein A2886_03315 [candidate division WWE3 bacterium RIFCSPHIGHO2_01_FULL_42_13]|uniref:Uncharacterized protein n=1 Tax=candidate division WWE3 bacterium RIFCSPHIGHO2_01_FULL_42_13 TaxID=1802617 RepID=A0A1F4USC2_UNCKA|nr:MAG: hypothetical protein A2886_03315 [candidate division WWE3 bacterium RIFCSPHIGHO2_01_FULL_42_13]